MTANDCEYACEPTASGAWEALLQVTKKQLANRIEKVLDYFSQLAE